MKVLLIDNEAAVSRSIALLLQGEKIFVDIAELGEEGVDFARHFDYDAIILDLNLPDMSGFEVLRILRRAGIDTPVLILSASLRLKARSRRLIMARMTI